MAPYQITQMGQLWCAAVEEYPTTDIRLIWSCGKHPAVTRALDAIEEQQDRIIQSLHVFKVGTGGKVRGRGMFQQTCFSQQSCIRAGGNDRQITLDRLPAFRPKTYAAIH